jgi:hypothetical protein
VAGQWIRYIRVSRLDQNEKRQLEGQVLDRVFTDKASGRDTGRPQLNRASSDRTRWGHGRGAKHGQARSQPQTTRVLWFRA